ncbi:MAG: hypothetical protein AAGA29_12575 [Planctomycetota bacterium]
MRSAIVSTGLFATCLAYAVVRYIVFGDVLPAQLPVFITNKALSLAGLTLIVLAVGARPIAAALPVASWLRDDRRTLGMVGLAFSAVHTVLSLMLLGPAYFGKFYSPTGQMTAVGEWAMLLGASALALLVWQSRVAPPTRPGVPNRAAAHRRMLGTGVLTLAMLHVGVMGWKGWFAPADWPGGLPPITLLSACVALVGIALGLAPRRKP